MGIIRGSARGRDLEEAGGTWRWEEGKVERGEGATLLTSTEGLLRTHQGR